MKISRENFCEKLKLKHPIICGPMYPCSNPELVAAASKEGILGVIQPLSMTYAHGWNFQEGLNYIRSVSPNTLGMNALIEASDKRYLDKMKSWVDQALENNVKVIITSLGKPDWVVKKAHAVGAYVFHDVTERKWALIGKDCGVDGLICVNKRAGGHLGSKSMEELYADLEDLKLPLVCAGGIADKEGLQRALKMGYCAVQMGTRFIASQECKAHSDYKQAIVKAGEKDIVETKRISGVPIAVINTEYVKKVGTDLSKIEKFFMKFPKTKKLLRMLMALKQIRSLAKTEKQSSGYKGYWSAGRSVSKISKVQSVQEIVKDLT